MLMDCTYTKKKKKICLFEMKTGGPVFLFVNWAILIEESLSIDTTKFVLSSVQGGLSWVVAVDFPIQK